MKFKAVRRPQRGCHLIKVHTNNILRQKRFNNVSCWIIIQDAQFGFGNRDDILLFDLGFFKCQITSVLHINVGKTEKNTHLRICSAFCSSEQKLRFFMLE